MAAPIDRISGRSPKAMTNKEIMRVVNRYIGVSGGYLGDFSYRTHADFYPEYCDLEIDPTRVDGTTRERFITILSSVEPRQQARILRGVTERFPVGAGPDSRTEERGGVAPNHRKTGGRRAYLLSGAADKR
jgi:hypothetical protein